MFIIGIPSEVWTDQRIFARPGLVEHSGETSNVDFLATLPEMSLQVVVKTGVAVPIASAAKCCHTGNKRRRLGIAPVDSGSSAIVSGLQA